MLQRQELYVGYSLHIGLNKVNPAAYGGWYGQLFGCLNDAESMAGIACSLGYAAIVLLNELAIIERVLTEIREVRKKILPGDNFLLTYSGHGGWLPDASGDEEDHRDETWCLYDGELLDDLLYAEFCKFPGRSRIIVVSDSCHSGTVVRGGQPVVGKRAMPLAMVEPAYLAKKEYYDSLPRKGKEKYNLQAHVCLLSGCQDNQYSMDGAGHGLFTERLLKVWDGGAFQGDYWQFNQAVLRLMPPDQSPGLLFLGPRNLAFEWSKPFVIR